MSFADTDADELSFLLSIPSVPPSANPFMRLHWAARHKLSIYWAYLLLEAGLSLVPKAVRKRRLEITLYTSKERDYPNLFLATDKLILDNLVKYQVLIDDSPKYLDLELSSKRGKPRTEVRIIDVDMLGYLKNKSDSIR